MELQGKTIAVTGASGMLGVYICRSLLRAGATVIGVVRNPSKAAFLATEGVQFRSADLMDPAALKLAFVGCDAVVSNAAMYVALKSMSAWQDHEKANLDGTRNVIEAAAHAGVKRVIHISTFGIYQWTMLRPLTEDTPQLNGAKRQGGPYRATKQMSEALAWQLASQHGIGLTTLRPSGIFGARDGNLLQLVYKILRSPLVLFPSVTFPIVYAGDVADAVVGALRQDKSLGQAYNVGGDNVPLAQFGRAILRALSRKPLVLFLPLPFGFRIDNRKAEREIGFRNRPFDEAMREIVREEQPPKYLGGT